MASGNKPAIAPMPNTVIFAMIFFIYPSKSYLPLKVKVVIDFLQKKFSSN